MDAKGFILQSRYTTGSMQTIFYGWWVVFASIIAMALSWPVFAIYALSAFMIPLQMEFGWQRGEMSYAVSVASLCAVFVSIVLGYLVDRFGVRKIALPSIVLLGITIGAMRGLTGAIWEYYFAFFCIAVLGAGTSVLVFSKLILNWFDRRRGLALGLAIAGVGLGQALIPPGTTYVINHYGWREAYLSLGLLILVVGGGVCWLLIREFPSSMGLSKDGINADSSDAVASALQPAGFTFKEAMGTRPFWLMLGSFFLVGLCIHGCAAHLIPLLVDRGISAQRAAGFMSALGIAVIFGRIFAGYLMDRIFAPWVGIGFMLAPVVGLSLLALGASGGVALLAAILLGLAIGAEFDILGYFISRYIGLRVFGFAYGLMLACFQLGGSIGPVVMGRGFDQTGVYTNVLWLFVGMFCVTCVLFSLLGPYPSLPGLAEERGDEGIANEF